MRRFFVLAVPLLVAVACADAATQRADAILAAREAVGDPAAEIGTLAEAVVAAVANVRLEGPSDPTDRQSTLDSVAEGPVASLADALSAAANVELTGSTEDVELAQEQWLAAQTATADLLEAATAQLDELARVIAWDLRLEELTDAWQQSGSRSTQLTRFADNASAADQLVLDISDDEPTTCPEQLERRVEAAEFVAAATRELREHIGANRGADFDRRRLELAEDPTGLGQPLGALDSQDATCWQSRSGITTTSILDALADLQAALNPPDLQGAR